LKRICLSSWTVAKNQCFEVTFFLPTTFPNNVNTKRHLYRGILLLLLLRWLVASLSPLTPSLNPRPVQVGFIVDRVALGRNFLGVLRLFPYEYNSTNAPYSFIYPSSVFLCNILGKLQM